jgi:hypothetical protein
MQEIRQTVQAKRDLILAIQDAFLLEEVPHWFHCYQDGNDLLCSLDKKRYIDLGSYDQFYLGLLDPRAEANPDYGFWMIWGSLDGTAIISWEGPNGVIGVIERLKGE